MRTRFVSRASAAVVVQHSNRNPCVLPEKSPGQRTSATQTEENPTSSAVNATRVIASYASTGSSIRASSFIGPCGRITPNVNDIDSLFPISFSNDTIIYIIVLVKGSQGKVALPSLLERYVR